MLSEDDITDEAGNMLGGKRAAMQFAHNKVSNANTRKEVFPCVLVV